jgi:polyisoprenoid-binding protein YceI
MTSLETAPTDVLPTKGTWTLDNSHSQASFVVRHLMVSKVRGRFGELSGTIDAAENPLESVVTATIDASTIDTRDEQRDAHLRSPDFLDVERFPSLQFRSTKITEREPGRWTMSGELTIRDVTRPVEVEVTYEGLAVNPFTSARTVGFSATTEIDREDFGLTWNHSVEGGGVLVGKKVQINLEVEGVQEA